LLLLFLISATLAISGPKRLRVGFDDNPPFCSVSADGKVQGLFPDVFEEIASKEGWQYEYVRCIRSQCMEDLASGKLDVLLSTGYSPQRAEYMDFSKEFLLVNWGQVYVSHNEKLESINHLENKRIAMVRGNIHGIAFRRLLADFGKSATFIEVDKMEDVFKELSKGNVDAGIVNRVFGQANEEKYHVYATPISFIPIEIKFAVPKGKHADIITALDSHIAKLKQQPGSVYTRSYEHWIGSRSIRRVIPDWVLPAVSSAILVTVVLILGVVWLRYEIRRKTAALSQAKEEAESNQRLYRATLDNTSQLQGLLSPGGAILNVNQTSLNIIGANKESVVGCLFWKTSWWKHDQKEQERLKDAIARCAKGESINYETTHQDFKGNLRYIDFSLHPVVDDTGAIIYLITEGRDISQRKRAEEQLRESEERYRQLVELSPDAIFIQSEGRIVYINAAGAKLFGAEDRDRLLGKQVLDLIHPDYLEIVQDRIRQLQEENTEVPLIEEKYLRLDGTPVDVEVAATPFIYQNKPAVQVIARDITERKLVEEALQESKEKISQILNSTAEGIYGLDLNGNCTFCNTSGLRILGYDNEEALIGKNMHELIHHTKADGTPYPEDECATRAASFKGEYFHKDRQILWRADMTRFPAEYWAHPIFRGNEFIGTVVTFVDITERVALETQFLQAQKMESVGRLAGGVAHDFNNMLGVILGHVDLAMMKVNPAEPINANLTEIQEAAQRSADLTRQLLAFARRQTVAPKVLDLNDSVTGMLKMLQRLIGEDIDLVWMPGSGLWPIKIDSAQIDQLLANLCINARDAIAGVGKITIETENIAVDKAYCDIHTGFVCGAYVMLAVSDDGSGMSKEVIDHLFEPFFTTKAVGKGTGLGLATVYGIVKQNDGFIKVYSEPGEGTTFKVYLPRLEGQAIEPQAESTADIPKGRGETILLVEDEPAIMNVSRAMLEELGYKVLTASTPGEGLSQFKAHIAEIQLLITDVVMPEMNGRDLAKSIRDINPGLKCLFISGYTANVIAHHSVLDEGVIFLQKPFSMNDLASKVREALEQK
jgi:PAS domain S-box-containing protein